MIEGSCHCGAVRWRFEATPQGATACNCTVCRRYGALWIYGHEGEDVFVTGPTKAYARGEKHLNFNFCPECGCIVSWRANSVGKKSGRRRMAVNVRLAEPDAVADLPIDHFEGFNTFEDLPRDGKRVADYWF
jgi:hypothetical protein